MKKYLIAFLLIISGCQTQKLNRDPSMSAMDANYPTAEFQACGKLWHGLGVCFVPKGQPLSSINLKVQGYYKGTIKAISGCGFEQNRRFENNELVDVTSAEIADKSCVVSVVMSPEYPNEEKQPIKVHSLKGVLAISVSRFGDVSEAYISKVKESLTDEISLNAQDDEPKRVVFRGCETSFDRVITPVDKKIKLYSLEVHPYLGKSECIMSGGMGTKPTTFMTWMMWGYDKGFEPLPVPFVKIEKDKISVHADSTVSIISVDSQYEIGKSATFKVDMSKEFIIRTMTVAGRTAIGVYSPITGEIVWKR